MKLDKISLLLLGALTLASCSDIDEQYPEGGNLLADQKQESQDAVPSRMDATLSGMYTMMGAPYAVYGSRSARADDFGFISAAISLDLEGADATSANNGYNWFSAACGYSTRDPNYANPYMRYTMPYRQIGVANEIINSVDMATAEDVAKYKAAQAYAIRAFDYMSLAPYFQGNYASCKD